jgi:aspartyl-tRNA(Asn)/glutamyl-tRNA(Gln) amidotransferase subunit A
MTRTAKDAALMLQVIAGHDSEDPNSTDLAVPSYTADIAKGIKGMRIGVLRGSYILPMDADIERALAESINTLKGLGTVVTDPLELPYIEDALPANIAIISSEAATFHQANMDERPGDYDEDVLTRLSIGRDHPATVYIAAKNTQRRVQEQLLDSLGNFDALLTPMLPLGAPPIGQDDVLVGGKSMDVRAAVTRYTQPFNLTGFPAISVPCGFTDDGLPIGLQLAGKPFEEASLLRIAHAYQGATDWHKQRPPVG